MWKLSSVAIVAFMVLNIANIVLIFALTAECFRARCESGQPVEN